MAGGLYSGHWGHMGRPHQAQNNIVTYQVSPFRQRAFAGAISKGIHNVFRRTMAQAPYIVIPFALGYSVFKYCNDKYAWYHTKEGHAHLEGH
ncbi:cytochrome b-c1 complex subunit 8 [Blastocladiella britannica]|nr:cytochrome b-c1 complex subunit 8 [Blastocladiella britannica]